jgi:hypothetical protein
MHAEFSKAWMAAPKPERDFAWSFVGQRKGARQGMVRTLSSDLSFLKLTERFNDTVDGLPPAELAEVYSRSHFVLCPGGNLNPDTFRIMEALYCHAIPVVKRFFGVDSCRLVYGKHPFVVARSWRSARKKMEKMLANPADLARKSGEVQKWFENFIESFNRDLPKILTGTSRRFLESGQFRIQRRARFNPYLFATFFFVFRSEGRLGRYLRSRAV